VADGYLGRQRNNTISQGVEIINVVMNLVSRPKASGLRFLIYMWSSQAKTTIS